MTSLGPLSPAARRRPKNPSPGQLEIESNLHELGLLGKPSRTVKKTSSRSELRKGAAADDNCNPPALCIVFVLVSARSETDYSHVLPSCVAVIPILRRERATFDFQVHDIATSTTRDGCDYGYGEVANPTRSHLYRKRMRRLRGAVGTHIAGRAHIATIMRPCISRGLLLRVYPGV